MKISNYFSWHEALWLPSWNREANESDGLTEEIKNNLIELFQTMDKIREFFDKPINVHVSFRPIEYNKQVGGATKSSHLIGKAVDFHVVGLDCDDARQQILDNNLLEKYSLRMEDRPGSNWIHIDNSPVISNRFFKP